MAKKTYIALNEKARSFTDTKTLFSIHNDQIKEIPQKLLFSYHIKRALQHGHLVKKTEAEYLEYKKKAEAFEAEHVDKTSQEEYIKKLEEKIAHSNNEIEKNQKTIKILRGRLEELENKEEVHPIEKLGSKDDVINYLEENYEIEEGVITRLSKMNRKQLNAEAISIVEGAEE